MTKKQVIKHLKYFSKWRHGKCAPEPNWEKTNHALNEAIRLLKESTETPTTKD